jgi:hypothetical protein
LLADLWLGKRLFGLRVGLGASWAWVFLPFAILFPLEWAWDQSLAALMLAIFVMRDLQNVRRARRV